VDRDLEGFLQGYGYTGPRSGRLEEAVSPLRNGQFGKKESHQNGKKTNVLGRAEGGGGERGTGKKEEERGLRTEARESESIPRDKREILKGKKD